MAADRSKSASLYRRASKVMVGGVSSPVRAFKAVGGTPLFIGRGKGSQVWDADGRVYTDYVCSWGAMVLGHADPRVVRSATAALKGGSSFGAPSVHELRLAEEVCKRMPSIEKVRFVNSGTEATMSALRLARAYTKRKKLVKFEGGYHGHADPFLTKAGSGMATLDLPASAGVTDGATADTVTLPYNDVGAVEELYRREPAEVAAVLVEPVAGNMGVVPPAKGFLKKLERLCRENGSLLVFDEVITGFRVAVGGAQSLYGVVPDITCLGKIIGGGFPVGAYGGKEEVMSMVAPEGPVYQAGTLSGNPVAMAAGLKTLSLLHPGSYSRLERTGRRLEEGFSDGARRSGARVTVNRVGSMVGLFFSEGPVTDFAGAKRSNPGLYRRFFWEMIGSGQYLPPSPFETIFVSLAHDEDQLDSTCEAAARAFRKATA